MSIKISRHADSWSRGTDGETKRKRKEVGEEEEDRLTDSDCSHHWRHNDGERHSTSDDQVPLVVGDVFAFVAVMDLTERRGADETQSDFQTS